jgi:3-oxoacyl-(acyl-carrier-protein) synthase
VRERIAVTGIGIASALGSGVDEVWAALERSESGLGELSLFSSPRCGHLPVAELPDDPAGHSPLRAGSRSDHAAAWAALDAFKSADCDATGAFEPHRAGILLGATTGGMLHSEAFIAKLMREGALDLELVRHHECASSTEAIAAALGLGGFRSTVSTACSSGAMAIMTACDVIRAGSADLMIAGGVDTLCRLTVNGFASLLVVAEDGCRPFDAERKGMSLGEGAAFVVLEKMERCRSRGIEPMAEVLGFGASCDAVHATAPDPEGDGIRRAMTAALRLAELAPNAIDYINAHGTGTRDNDTAEAKAIREIFGPAPPPVSSTKRFFGHTLAAAGAIEAVVCILAMRFGKLPPNLGLRAVDPEVGFEPIRECRSAELHTTMTNSLGFGGNNCSLILGRAITE